MTMLMRQKSLGFTLAELLISLAILGVIATFTIPKVLNGSQNGQMTAVAKEAISAVSGAYQAYRLDNTVDANTSWADLTAYLNYIRVDTASFVDGACSLPPSTASCSPVGIDCLKSSSGAIYRFQRNQSFNGTGALNGIEFRLDPDGTFNSEKSIQVYLYFNGRITTRDGIFANTTNSHNTTSPISTCQPDWFEW